MKVSHEMIMVRVWIRESLTLARTRCERPCGGRPRSNPFSSFTYPFIIKQNEKQRNNCPIMHSVMK